VESGLGWWQELRDLLGVGDHRVAGWYVGLYHKINDD